MLGSTILAAVVAVLSPTQVCFLDTAAWKSACTALPGAGVTVFATPDRKALIPLEAQDRTLLVEPAGKAELWPGRLFPVFFDESDRAYVVVGGELITMSYPDRLAMSRTVLKGVTGARLVACSSNGQLAAVVPTGDDTPTVLLAAPRQHRVLLRAPLPAPVLRVVVRPDESYAMAVLADGRVVVVSPEVGLLPGVLTLPRAPAAVVISSDSRRAVLGVVQDGGGLLIGVNLRSDPKRPFKETFRVEVGGPVRALAVAGPELVVLVGDRVELRGKGGRMLLRELTIPGAFALAVLPDTARSTIPSWDEE